MNLDVDVPGAEIHLPEPEAELDIDIDVKKPKYSGFSCLDGEKPDPYLLKLKGPKVESKDKSLSLKSKSKGPACLKGEADFEVPSSELSVEGPKLSHELKAELPDVSLTTEGPKSKEKFEFQLPEVKMPSADFELL